MADLIDFGNNDPSNEILIEIEKLQTNNIRELIAEVNKQLLDLFNNPNKLNDHKIILQNTQHKVLQSLDNILGIEHSDKQLKKELIADLKLLCTKIKILMKYYEIKKEPDVNEMMEKLYHTNGCLSVVILLSLLIIILLLVYILIRIIV